MAALFRMYPQIEPEDLLSFQISRERFVYPLPTLGYSSRVPAQQTSAPGLHIVNSAQIVNGTLNVNETVRLAENALPRMLREHLVTREKPLCSLSLDLDNQWSYMKTHGDAGWESFPSYLDLVVPRFPENPRRLRLEDHRLRSRPGRGPRKEP